MDFGLARMSGSDMTSTGTVMGTPHYMSPEQVRGQKADARSDVFALGCVFYELLSGRKPFDAESMHGVLFKVMQEEPSPLAEIVPDTPPMLIQIVEKALAKDPAERFQTAGELLAALRRARACGGRRPRSRARPRPRAAGRADLRRAARGEPQRRALRIASRRQPVAAAGRSGGVQPRLPVARPRGGARRPRPGRLAGGGRAHASAAAVAGAPRAASRSCSPKPIATHVQLARRRLDQGDLPGRHPGRRQRAQARPGQRRRKDREGRGQRTAAEGRGRVGRAPEGAGQPGRRRGGGLRADEGRTDARRGREGRPSRAAPPSGLGPRRRGQLAADARAAAESAGASSQPAFADGSSLEKQGQQALASGQIVPAARYFLEASHPLRSGRGGLRTAPSRPPGTQ